MILGVVNPLPIKGDHRIHNGTVAPGDKDLFGAVWMQEHQICPWLQPDWVEHFLPGGRRIIPIARRSDVYDIVIHCTSPRYDLQSEDEPTRYRTCS
jgi:hypothetical protein